MYPRIPWELVAGPKGFVEHTFGDHWSKEIKKKKSLIIPGRNLEIVAVYCR